MLRMMPLFEPVIRYRHLSGRLAVAVIDWVVRCQGETAEPRGGFSIGKRGRRPGTMWARPAGAKGAYVKRLF